MLIINQISIIDVILIYDAAQAKMDYFIDGIGAGWPDLFPIVLDK